MTDSTISDGGEGLFAYTNAAGGVAKIFVTRSTLHNVFYALDAETNGLGTAAIYAGGNMVDGSLNGWYQSGTGSSVVSYGNNQFSGSSGNLGSMTFNSLQ